MNVQKAIYKLELIRRINKNTNCWEGIRNFLDNGYIMVSIEGRAWLAHRLSYAITYGFASIKNKNVLHSCDNRKCFNPLHLFIGTQQNNIDDMMQKGRNRNPVGVQVGTSKLDDRAVLEIRFLLSEKRTQKEIAEMYQVDQSLISMIKNRRIWVHI